jgi:hypothetical protein
VVNREMGIGTSLSGEDFGARQTRPGYLSHERTLRYKSMLNLNILDDEG